MGNRTIKRVVRLLAAVLVLGNWGAFGAGQVLALESLKQVTDTTDGFYYTHPSVSADGTRIAFWSAGQQAIYVVNGDGTGFSRQAGPSADRSSGFRAMGPPSISADGQWMVFAGQYLGQSTRTCSCGDIWLIPANGGAAYQLTPALTGDSEQDQGKMGSRGNPVISGDRSLVVFASNSNFTGQNADGSEELFAIGTNGAGLRQITNTIYDSPTPIGATLTFQDAMFPSMDYRGSQVAFFLQDRRLRRTDGGADNISFDISLYGVNTDGTGLRKLSNASQSLSLQAALGERPFISGDGLTAVFPASANLGGGNPEGNLELFTIKMDGAGLTQLTSAQNARSAYPTLTFDGSRVAFTQQDPSIFERQWYEVYAINSDGSGLTQLTRTPGDPVTNRSGFEGVAFSADGTQVVFSSSGDLLGKNADANYELYSRRFTSVLPVQGVRNQRVAADLLNNRYSLVAKRDLVVRAFFDTGSGGASVAARGRLVVDEGTARATTFITDTYTARPPGYFDDKPDARVRLEDSLNFFITGQTADDILTAGAHTFRATVEPQGAGGFTPWEETFQGSFREADTVDVYIIPIRVKNSAGVFVEPEAALLEHASEFLRSTYPLDESNNKVRNIVLPISEDLDQAPNTDQRQGELSDKLADRLTKQLLKGQIADPAQRNVAAGVLPNLVDGQGSLGTFIGSNGDTLVTLGYTMGAVPGVERVVVALDRDPAAPNPPMIGSTVAHEIGHTFGLGDEYSGGTVSTNNPPPAAPADGDGTGHYVQEVDRGLDTSKRGAVFNRPGNAFYGYMGGSHDLNSWVTGVEYSFIYPQVTTNTVGGSEKAAAATRLINVSGTVTRTGGIQLDTFVVGSSQYAFTRPSGNQYYIQLKDSIGTVLDTVGFNIDFSKEVRGVGRRPLERVPFSFTVPLPEGVSSAVVLTGTTPVITYTVSAQPPAIRVLAPNGGEELRGPGQVRWQASDPDGDSLTYTVLYSPNGRDRYVVANGLTTTTLDLDFGRLPAGERASVIVEASDGFNYAEDASDAPFTAGPRQIFVPLLLKNGGW